MNMNVNRAQNNVGVFKENPSEVTSLSQMMSNKAPAKSETPIAEEPPAPPPLAEEDKEKVKLYSEFKNKILDGTSRSREEVSLLLKEILSTIKLASHKKTEAKMGALRVTIEAIDQNPDQNNSSLRKTLLDEFKGLMNVKKLNRKITERFLNPTKENGGLDIYGNSRKEWYKHL